MSASSVSAPPHRRAAVLGLCLVLAALLLTPVGLAAADEVDVTPPTGTIGRPPAAQAGQPANFTANVSDDPFGSGIDPNGYLWTAPGFEDRTGASTTYTFPTAGEYTVNLSFRDLAGNTKSVSVKVPVIADQSQLPEAGVLPPKAKIAATKDRKSITVAINGRIEPVFGPPPVTGEPLLMTTVCHSSVALSVRKGTTSIATGTVNLVRRTCGYSKTLTIDRKKLGTAKTLSVVVRFNANPAMRRTTKAFTVKIPKLPAIPKDKKKKS